MRAWYEPWIRNAIPTQSVVHEPAASFYLWAFLESRISGPGPTQLQLASQHLRWYVSTLKLEIHCFTNRLSSHTCNLKSGRVWQSKAASTPWNMLTGGTGLDGCCVSAPYTLFQPVLTACERGAADSSHYRWGHGGAEEESRPSWGHSARKWHDQHLRQSTRIHRVNLWGSAYHTGAHDRITQPTCWNIDFWVPPPTFLRGSPRICISDKFPDNDADVANQGTMPWEQLLTAGSSLLLRSQLV